LAEQKALIAMSGGVDSSVAAYLMMQQGYDCTGVTMRLYTNEEIGVPKGHTCCSLDDVADARNICFTLGIPYYVLNFSDRFREMVIDRFIHAYENGMTPNPCIDCNRYLKFDLLFRRAAEMGCEKVATGHYARVSRDPQSGRWLLAKGVDPSKDQSYVLYTLTQDQLAHVAFPLGGLTKTRAREIAEQQGFVNARKHDSQDICFVPDGDYAGFIARTTGRDYPEGDFVDLQGNVVGRHQGIIHYTIGQRKGLGLALGHPVFVCGIDPVRNRVTVCSGEELFTRHLTAENLNLIAVDNLRTPLRVRAKVRYRQTEQWATAVQTGDDTLELLFDKPQRAITAGQAVVLYDGDIVVGGGTIAPQQHHKDA